MSEAEAWPAHSRAWRDREGYPWIEAGEPGSGQVFCYDGYLRRRMLAAWPVQALEDAERDFGPMTPMEPAAHGDQEARYMLQFRHGDAWIDSWRSAVPLKTIEAMGGFQAVLERVAPGSAVRIVVLRPEVVASAGE